MNQQFTTQESELLKDILRFRRDVRGNRFLDKPVSKEVINQLLEAALYAPSVGFSQPWQFVVIRDEKIKQQVHKSFQGCNEQAQVQFSSEKQKHYQSLKLDGILESPVNMAIFYKPSKGPVLGQASMPEMGKFSVVCAIQNLWLMARSLNIGVGWVSILNPEEVKEAVNAPKDSELIAYLCIGYVSAFLDKPELEEKGWGKRKEKEAVIFFEQY
jgi:5,6-dimethylbenzimidazole synthase